MKHSHVQFADLIPCALIFVIPKVRALAKQRFIYPIPAGFPCLIHSHIRRFLGTWAIMAETLLRSRSVWGSGLFKVSLLRPWIEEL